MTTRTKFAIVCLLALASRGTPQTSIKEDGQKARAEIPIVLTASRASPLWAVLRVASENKTPLGIAFGTHPVLCSEERPLQINATNLKDAFLQALAGTGYTVEMEGGVYTLTAPDTTTHEMALLNYRFQKFSATDSTMSGAGQLLAGYIRTVAEGATSFAGDTIYSTTSQKLTIQMYSSTTKEIANQIVSQNGKGVWVFRPTADAVPASGRDTPVQIYSYEENSKGLESLGCGIDAGE
jgi:hypothetical protein